VALQFSFQSNEFSHFVDARIRWLQAQLSHIQAMKALLREKKKSNPQVPASGMLTSLQPLSQTPPLQPAVQSQKRRSDWHCHQVSWMLCQADKEFKSRQQRRRNRTARIALSWMPASSPLSESPLRNATRTSLRAY
jgi:hypothetical protein